MSIIKKPRGHAVNSQEEHLLRADDAKQKVDVIENRQKDLLLGEAEMDVVGRMRTRVDNPVHVQVQIVYVISLIIEAY